jgi:hypothetical protein
MAQVSTDTPGTLTFQQQNAVQRTMGGVPLSRRRTYFQPPTAGDMTPSVGSSSMHCREGAGWGGDDEHSDGSAGIPSCRRGHKECTNSSCCVIRSVVKLNETGSAIPVAPLSTGSTTATAKAQSCSIVSHRRSKGNRSGSSLSVEKVVDVSSVSAAGAWGFFPVEVTFSLLVVVAALAQVDGTDTLLDSMPPFVGMLIGIAVLLCQALLYPRILFFLMLRQDRFIAWTGFLFLTRVWPYAAAAFHKYSIAVWVKPFRSTLVTYISDASSLLHNLTTLMSNVSQPIAGSTNGGGFQLPLWTDYPANSSSSAARQIFDIDSQLTVIILGFFLLVFLLAPIHFLTLNIGWCPFGMFDLGEGLVAEVTEDVFTPNKISHPTWERCKKRALTERRQQERLLTALLERDARLETQRRLLNRAPNPLLLVSSTTELLNSERGLRHVNPEDDQDTADGSHHTLGDQLRANENSKTSRRKPFAKKGSAKHPDPNSIISSHRPRHSAEVSSASEDPERFHSDPSQNLGMQGNRPTTQGLEDHDGTQGTGYDEGDDVEGLEEYPEGYAQHMTLYPPTLCAIRLYCEELIRFLIGALVVCWCACILSVIRIAWHSIGGPTSNEPMERRWFLAKRLKLISSSVTPPSSYAMQRLKFLLAIPVVLSVTPDAAAPHVFTALNVFSVMGWFVGKPSKTPIPRTNLRRGRNPSATDDDDAEEPKSNHVPDPHPRYHGSRKRSSEESLRPPLSGPNKSSEPAACRTPPPAKGAAGFYFHLTDPRDFAWYHRWMFLFIVVFADVLLSQYADQLFPV